MERVQFITHRGAKILRVDLSATPSVEKNIEVLNRAKAIIGTQPPGSVLLLTDVTKAHFNARGVAEFKEYSTFNTPYLKASAVLGIVGIYKVIYEAIVRVTGRNIVCFDTEAQALDWLAER
ncbi:MAG: hypothetical protein ABR961_14705 [Thermoanaerobaculaceae bacterium]|jgi:hypothetical protein